MNASPNRLEGAELEARVAEFPWYHRIRVAEGIYTPDWWCGTLVGFWDTLAAHQAAADLAGKDVLDVGCRDGLFSFQAEQQGARRVVGIDNDLSRGAKEFLIPYFGSRVELHELNLYDLTPETFGTFDVVLCYGVLYHLRYPMFGLRRLADVLREGGLLLLEAPIVVDRRFRDEELLYCPVENSPYEPTSCTFFNLKGLEATLKSLGMELTRWDVAGPAASGFKHECERLLRRVTGRRGHPDIARLFMVFTKKRSASAADVAYWEGLHRAHTEPVWADLRAWQAREK